ATVTPHRSSYLRAAVLVQLVFCTACADHTPGTTDASAPINLEGVVTGAAAAAVGADGRFKLPAPPAGSEEEISGERAVELAAAWGRQFASFFERKVESTRGMPVDINNLKPCGRPLYASGNYEPLPATVPLIFRRPFQSYWFVALCGRSGEPEVSLAVSATSTDLTLVDGRIRFPPLNGNNFYVTGIPRHWNGGPLPYSPEAAALEAAGRTARQVTLVPELRMPDLGKTIPQGARWLVTIDAKVSMQGEKRAHLPPTRQFFVGVDPQRDQRPGVREISVPSDSQPVTSTFQYGRFDSEYRLQGSVTGTAVRKDGFPVSFEVVQTKGAP
ncbi:MAG: hypothetical protein ACREL6_05595, partial [Gemmatimonadales bacterium]